MRRCYCSNNNQNTINTTNTLGINENRTQESDNNQRSNTSNDTIQDKLKDFLGLKCLCTFAINSDNEIEERTGVLQEVGYNYLILKSCSTGNCTLCNTSHLLFIRCCN